MAYPDYLGPAKESAVLKDLEYLQQTYPKEVRAYQGRIAEILDKLDYEGSMIYDEYPDSCSIRRLAGTIVRIMKQEEKDSGREDPASEERWRFMEDMVQVLLCNEIYKRRHGGRRGSKIFVV